MFTCCLLLFLQIWWLHKPQDLLLFSSYHLLLAVDCILFLMFSKFSNSKKWGSIVLIYNYWFTQRPDVSTQRLFLKATKVTHVLGGLKTKHVPICTLIVPCCIVGIEQILAVSSFESTSAMNVKLFIWLSPNPNLPFIVRFLVGWVCCLLGLLGWMVGP